MQDSYIAVASSWGFFFLVAVTLALLAIGQEEVSRSRIPVRLGDNSGENCAQFNFTPYIHLTSRSTEASLAQPLFNAPVSKSYNSTTYPFPSKIGYSESSLRDLSSLFPNAYCEYFEFIP
jgi:hypothetical protein